MGIVFEASADDVAKFPDGGAVALNEGSEISQIPDLDRFGFRWGHFFGG